MAARKIPAEAVDTKTGMTLDELAEFVQRAMKAGATGSEVPEVTTGGFGRLRLRTVKVTITGDQQD